MRGASNSVAARRIFFTLAADTIEALSRLYNQKFTLFAISDCVSYKHREPIETPVRPLAAPIVLMIRLTASILLIIFGFIASPALAATLLSSEVETGHQVERISLSFSGKVAHKKLFFLDDPYRMVIDLPSVDVARPIHLPGDYAGSMLQGLRFGQYNGSTSRIVADLQRPVRVENVYLVTPAASGSWRLVFDIVPASPDAVESGGETPHNIKGGGLVPVPTAKPLKQADRAALPLVAIDAGHGGQDSGAISVSGLKEKNITLGYALALRDTLQRSGRYKVMLTRDDDTYLLLRDRVKLARNAKADIFISLHADSNPRRDARGFSAYTVSESASDDESAALAKQENKADAIAGIMDLSTEDEDVANILIDLAQRETKNKSSELADFIVKSMHPKVPLLSNTHRYAGFRVLKAPDVPSVLLEIGFLSNRQDEKLIQSREYKQMITDGIVKGIDTYFLSRRNKQ